MPPTFFGYTNQDNLSLNTDSWIGFIAIFFAIFFIILLITYVINSIFLSKVFKKGGVPSYIAWIPVWNYWQLFELGGQKGYLSLLIFASSIISNLYNNFGYAAMLVGGTLSIAYVVFFVITIKNVGNSFGKSNSFAILGFFFFTIWAGILALGKSAWNGYTQELTPSSALANNLKSQYNNDLNPQRYNQQPPTNSSSNSLGQASDEKLSDTTQQRSTVSPNPDEQTQQPPTES